MGEGWLGAHPLDARDQRRPGHLHPVRTARSQGVQGRLPHHPRAAGRRAPLRRLPPPPMALELNFVSSKIYIHELIEIVGHNRAKYQHHMTANWVPVAIKERNQRCYGVWSTIGSTGRWPEV